MNTPQDDGGSALTEAQEYLAMMREANRPETKEKNLRDWFAGMALGSMEKARYHSEGPTITEMAQRSYDIADAMIDARKE